MTLMASFSWLTRYFSKQVLLKDFTERGLQQQKVLACVKTVK